MEIRPFFDPCFVRNLQCRIRAVGSVSEKTTYIYGLIDPRNQQLRYVGKTVLEPPKRLSVHQWRARKEPHKRHSMAWLLGLDRAGLSAEIFVIEEVPAGADWVAAEQFWIGYFRMIGADLCNHTTGGEGQTGYKQPPEVIAKRIRRGPDHHCFGKPQHPNARAALRFAGERLRADPERWKSACDNRRAAFTEDMKVARIENLHRHMANPELRSRADAKRAEISRRTEKREAVGLWSKNNWETKRGQIIAAQNAGKGDEWRRRHAAIGKTKMASVDHPLRIAAFKRRKLSDADILEIRRRLAQGERAFVLAPEYGVSQTTISDCKTGRYRKV